MRAAVVSVLLAGALIAQSTNAPAFAVASIRLHEGRAPRTGFIPAGATLTVMSVSVDAIVTFAYGLKDYQILGATGWVSSDGWDITAQAEGETAVPLDRFRLMMRTLLADRYRLKFHRETKETPVYALVVAGKNGPKFKASTAEGQGMTRMTADQMIVTKGDMPTFATRLSHLNGIDRPVFDKTGLAGSYDFTLTLGTQPPDEGDLDAMLQDQLGLKLTAQKAPVEMLVIDHAEKPSEN